MIQEMKQNVNIGS